MLVNAYFYKIHTFVGLNKRGDLILVNIDKIKTLAKEQGIKLSFICSKLGLSGRTYFQDIKKNKSDIPDARLQVIADILHTSPAYLRDETDDKKPPDYKAEELTPEIQDILDRVKKLPLKKQKMALEYLRFLDSRRND